MPMKHKSKRTGPTPGIRKRMDTPAELIELSLRGDLPKELWPVLDWLRIDCPDFRRRFYAWARDCYRRGDGAKLIQLGKHLEAHGPEPADPVVFFLNEFFAAIEGRDEEEDSTEQEQDPTHMGVEGNPTGPVWYIGGKRPEAYTLGELSEFLKSNGVDATDDQIREAKRLLGVGGVRGRRKSG